VGRSGGVEDVRTGQGRGVAGVLEAAAGDELARDQIGTPVEPQGKGKGKSAPEESGG